MKNIKIISYIKIFLNQKKKATNIQLQTINKYGPYILKIDFKKI